MFLSFLCTFSVVYWFYLFPSNKTYTTQETAEYAYRRFANAGYGTITLLFLNVPVEIVHMIAMPTAEKINNPSFGHILLVELGFLLIVTFVILITNKVFKKKLICMKS